MGNKCLKLFVTLFCIAVLVAACGRKTDPQPEDIKNLFTWQNTEAHFVNNDCLIINGKMSGATRNVDGFTLELEPLKSHDDSNLPPELAALPDSCEGCPFTPRERSEIRPQKSVSENNGITYTFSYCPAIHAKGYRWRIVARNIFLAFPFAISQIQTIQKE